MEESKKFIKKKSLGQHFLTSDVVPTWMCDAGGVTQGDVVVEVGPGTGVLTKEILARGARVIAVEADIRAIAVLEKTFQDELAAGKLILHHADAKTLDLETLSVTNHEYKVVANIPYYISGLLFRTFLESNIQPHSLVFLVQKEVAERIARDPKESLLSISVKIFGTPTYVKTVGRGHFVPPPKIDSAIIKIADISKEQLKGINSELFFEILHLGFGQKRKQLLGNLAKKYDRTILTHIFSTLNIPLDVRAEDIAPEIWPDLITHILSTGN